MSTEKTQPESQEIVVPDKANATIEIVPFGTTDKIKLSASIVRQMIAVPTRNKKLPDDNQCIKFIMLCAARHLNPFEGDAYMIGYDTQDGAQFSLITAHQVFLKRAEASKEFKGMQSGVIVERGDSTGPYEREGDMVYAEEKLLGGWAKVYRKNLEHPFYRRLKLSTFNTGRSRWEKDPAGMICKCAEADALRTAFPTLLGGLYIDEEREPIDIVADQIKIEKPKFKALQDVKDETISQLQKDIDVVSSEPKGIIESTPVTVTELPPKKKLRKLKNAPSEPEIGPKEAQMLKTLELGGKTKDDLVRVAKKLGALEPEDDWKTIDEDGFLELLHPDTWSVVQEELEK
jgi:phage recombination protein Bet